MQIPSIPSDEQARLKALHSLNVLDTEAEESYDRLTRLTKQLFNVPIALISLIDEDRQWFKSRQGLDVCETGRDISFCGHAIHDQEIFEIEDATQDSRFFDNPLVSDGLKIRFYAGAPLITREGFALGTLCIIDTQPRKLTATQRSSLRDLADTVVSELERHESYRRYFEYEKLQKLTQHITRAQSNFICEVDKPKAFDHLLTDLLELTASEYGFIGEVLYSSEAKPYLKTYAITNIAWNEETRKFYDDHAQTGLEFTNLDTLFGAVLKSGEPVIANDPYQDPRRGGLPEGHPVLNAFLGIPIKHGDNLVAMIGLSNRAGGYDQALIDYLSPFLKTIGQLIHATMLQKLHEQNRLQIERLSNVASQTTNAVIISDVEGKIEWVNEGFSRITGYGFSEVQGKKPSLLLQGPDTDQAAIDTMRKAIALRQEFDVTVLNYTKENQPYWIRIQCSPLYDDQNKHTGFMSVETDVTESRQAEEALKISEARLRQFKNTVDQARDCVFMFDAQTMRFFYVNRGAKDQVGYTEQEMLSKHAFDIKPYMTEEQFRQMTTRIMQSEAKSITFETVHQHKQGQLIDVEIMLQYVDTNGDFAHFVAFVRDITEKKKLLADLQTSEKRLRQFFELSPFGIALNDYKTGTFIDVNPALVKPSGYSSEEFFGLSYWELTPREYESQEQLQLASLKETGRYGPYEKEYLHKDGGRYPVVLNGMLVDDKDGNQLIWSIVEDISERKRHQQALQEERDLFSSGPVFVITWGASEHWPVKYVSENILDILGYTPKELMSADFRYADLIHPSDIERISVEVTHNIEQHVDNYEQSYRLRTKNGSYRWFYDFSKLVRDDNGEVVNIRGYMFDQTEIKKIEQELKDQSNHTKAIINNMVDGIITINTNGVIQSFNPAAERIFGYSPTEVIGKNVSMLMPNPHREAHNSYLYNYLSTGVGHIIGAGREVEGLNKDGNLFPMELSISEVHINDELQFIGMVRDISERKRVENMKSEFVSTVSHELRTPLTSISGALGLIMGGRLGELPAQSEQMLSIAHKNTLRLSHLINDLLDMEKMVSGKLHFDMQVQPLLPIIEQALENYQTYSAEQKIKLSLQTDITEADVRVDEQRLQQVLANLLSNAMKYSPEFGKVTICVTPLPGLVNVSINDEGPGIPEAFQSRIFEKFSQADSSDTRQKSGTGLGLAITRELVERMGGRIGFDSVEGEGARFWFELPLINEAHHCASDSAFPTLSNDPQVLIVEDEPDVAAVLSAMLARSGYQVKQANTGLEALALLEQQSFDVMTLDLMLPDISGLEVIHRVRLASQTENLPILVISAKMQEGRLTLNGDFSGIDWLAKPIEEERMLNVLEGLVNQSNKAKIHVLHVEDDTDLGMVIGQMLGEAFDYELVTSLTLARDKLAEVEYDVILLDLGLPDGVGLELLPEIRNIHPQTRVIVLSGEDISNEVFSKVDAVMQKSRLSPKELLNLLSRKIQ